MKTARIPSGWTSLVTALLVMFLSGAALSAQNTKIPSTLRFGSGIIDVPVASVLPHMAITGTYSGFSTGITQTLTTNAIGDITGLDGPYDKWLSDASVAIGLFDRVELGATFQQFGDANAGGTMVGGFGRFAVIRPEQQGIGLALGGQFVSAPSFDGTAGNLDFKPSRLGHPDVRLYKDYGTDKEEVNTSFSPYAVATAQLRGFESDFFPEHDFTFTLGWGEGTFRDGKDIDWYSFVDSNGWFAGTALHLLVADNTLLNLMGEWNGFDLNLGAQLDFGGIRVGGFILGVNYEDETSVYRSKKYGILGSIALCPNIGGGLCKPGLLDRPKPDTIQLPAPPPDTVVVTREVVPPLPTGTPTMICLATGTDVQVLVTAQGDTLVGPGRTPIGDLRPGIVFAGTYAQGAEWYETDASVTYDRGTYQKSGGEVRLGCGAITQVGSHEGVPLFANTGAERPLETIYVPVRPGVWQAYQAGLRRTRG